MRQPPRPPRPPRLARALLYVVLPAAINEPLIGDLDELFHARAADQGASRARGWYWSQTLRALFATTIGRLIPHDHLRAARHTGDGFVTTLFADVRLALRMLARRPAFTSLAVLTLALGIGATTALYSAIRPVLIDSLPYPAADRLAMVWEGGRHGDSNVGFTTFSELAAQNRSFASLAAMGDMSGILTGRDEPQLLAGQRVSPTFFSVLGVHPAIGRDFRADEDVASAGRVIILSDALWRSRFGGDTAVLNTSITLDANSYTVIGVMPHGFENVLDPKAQLWTLLRYNVTLPYACRDCRHLRVAGRLRPGVTLEAAQREMSALLARMAAAYPDKYDSKTMRVPSLQADLTEGVRQPLWLLLGAVGVMLLIACANVTNLLLARGAQRQGEFAIRAALGAGRGRVVRQLLTESLVLSVAGGVAGVLVAQVGVRALVALAPPSLPRRGAIAMDGGVLLFALALATLVGLAFGLVPALHASRSNLHHDMQLAGRRASARLTRGAFVVAEVAMALVLLVGAGLLVRSVRQLLAVSPGFDASRLVTMQVQTGGLRYRNDTVTRAFFDEALARVRALPGVEGAAFTNQLPLSGDFDMFGVHPEVPINANPALDGGAHRYSVSPGYLETMHIPVVDGRAFTAADRGDAPKVAIVSAAMAQRMWPHDRAIGKRVRVGALEGPLREIVGVVGDVRQVSLGETTRNAIYLPESQWQFADGAMSLVVRTGAPATAMARSVRDVIKTIDANQPIVRVASMDDLLTASAADRRFALALFEAFGVIAIVLAGAGLYGVISGRVAERMREIGVRAALGASARDIVWMVLREGATLAGIGMAIGLVASFALARTMDSLLYGVSRADPLTYAAVCLLLAAVALAACLVPARRAARMDPVGALRAD